VTIWEILSRRVPFESKTVAEVMDEVVHQRLRLPLPARWPEVWRNLLSACWRTDPTMRPGSVMVVAQWLQYMSADYEANPANFGTLPAIGDEEIGARGSAGHLAMSISYR